MEHENTNTPHNVHSETEHTHPNEHTEHEDCLPEPDVVVKDLGVINIDVVLNEVSILVYNNCKSLLIRGHKTKIKFDFPFNKQSVAHDDTHEDELVHNHTDDSANSNEEIVFKVQDVIITLCECCSILKIKHEDSDLAFPLADFQKADNVLTQQGQYEVRDYFVKHKKHKTNSRDQQLFINNKPIQFEYSPTLRCFKSHLFFGNYSNVMDILSAYLKANPDLGEFTHHH
jgi:hypothetical protein